MSKDNKDNNGWISVEDALPQKEGRYLCYSLKDKMQIIVFLHYDIIKSGSTKYFLRNFLSVSYWQELPPSPED